MSNSKQNKKSQLQDNPRNEVAVNALDSLLTAAGFDAGDLQIALEAITTAKEQSQKKTYVEGDYAYFLDRTLVYEDQDAFIYKRADTKSGRWYFRIYDAKRGKPIKKALKTSDKTQALATARMLYIDIKGKIERGERLKSITTMELVDMWEEKLSKQVTDTPHLGLTPDSFKQKRYFLKNWRDYLIHLRIQKTSLDKVAPEKLRDFGTWYMNKPKETAFHTGKVKSTELINNNISEVIRMYHQLGVRERYISGSQVPQIDRLKQQLDERFKRDIMDEDEYEEFWRYTQFNYLTKKHNPLIDAKELEIRKIWKEFIFIMSNVGFRPKELLGIKLMEITDNPKWDDKRRETDCLMKVRKENSKTGRARVCVAPVKKRIQRVLAAYKKIGIEHQPEDYLFISHRWVVNGKREPYTRQTMYCRLKTVLIKSGLMDKFKKQDKRISLYSFRHQYACWRLRYGDVPIHLLAKQMGTSIQKIEATYGHIQVEQQAEVITKAQEHIKKTGTDIAKPEIIEEADLDEIIKQAGGYLVYASKTQNQKKKVKV